MPGGRSPHSFQKRQRELEKKRKREEKLARRAAAKKESPEHAKTEEPPAGDEESTPPSPGPAVARRVRPQNDQRAKTATTKAR